MPEPIVYALATLSTRDPNTGLIVRISEGEPWAADDPFVAARTDLFGTFPERVRRTAPPKPVIEKATKAPGEKRTRRVEP